MWAPLSGLAAARQVSLVQFASVAGKKNKTTGTMTVKGVAWDTTLGGWLFDQVPPPAPRASARRRAPAPLAPRPGPLRLASHPCSDAASALPVGADRAGSAGGAVQGEAPQGTPPRPRPRPCRAHARTRAHTHAASEPCVLCRERRRRGLR